LRRNVEEFSSIFSTDLQPCDSTAEPVFQLYMRLQEFRKTSGATGRPRSRVRRLDVKPAPPARRILIDRCGPMPISTSGGTHAYLVKLLLAFAVSNTLYGGNP
jgi:hypothetical protein